MLQPFECFRLSYIDRLLQVKKNYLVSQYYARGEGRSELALTPLIVSAYDDLGLAKTHWNAVKEDRYAAIIHLEKPAHNQKLREMLCEGSKYQVYWAVVKSKTEFENRVNSLYKENMRRYIQQNTNWRIDHEASVKPSIELTFGHLYLVLKRGGQTIRTKFEEIENA
jgi:hypothetical protein